MISGKFRNFPFHQSTRLVLVLMLSLFCHSVWSAEISTTPTKDGEKQENLISIVGEIENGDYEKFRSIVLCDAPHTFTVYIVSSGGDVAEALKIGSLIRELGVQTDIPLSDGFNRILYSIDVPESVDQVCASACFFIYVGGIRRAGSRLGIHRPFMSEDAYRQLSAHDALNAGQYFKSVISNYLTEMGVSQSYLDRMYAIPKDQIEWIPKDEVVRDFDGFIPELEEWADAKCGDDIHSSWGCKADALYENSMSQKRKYKKNNGFSCRD